MADILICMPQRKSLSQMEKQQEVKKGAEKKAEKKSEKVIGSLEIPDFEKKEVLEQFRRMGAITPSEVAIQFNIKVSAAKRLLEELRRRKIVDLVSGGHNLKIYTLSKR